MSKMKSKNILLVMIFILISFFAFGCERDKTPVEDIYFKVEGNEEQIVLLIGQSLELEDYIYIKPNYASNKHYYLESFDSSIVSVTDSTIKANKEGLTYIKVIAEDDANRHDLINVSVKSSQVVLETPSNLSYNQLTQSFTFDPVLNAAGYVLEIKNLSGTAEHYDLGNTTSFALENYTNTKYNTVLAASVKAYAPSYSYVFKESAFTQEYKIYQSSVINNAVIKGGELRFSQSSSSNAIIYYNGEEVSLYENRNVIHSLKSLEAKYAGTNLSVQVKTTAKSSVKNSYGYDVNYFDSKLETINVSVLEELIIVMNGSILSWNNVANVGEYEIYINNFINPIARTNDNAFDLKDLASFNTYTHSANDYVVKVLPVISENSINLGKTVIENSILFNRMESVEVKLSSNGVYWDSIDNASIYSLNIEYNDTNTIISTKETSLSFDNYSSGDYKVSVQALGASVGSVNYVSSIIDEEKSVYEFRKLGTTNLEVLNYQLSITTPTIGEDYLIEFNVDDTISISETITSSGQFSTLSLKTYNFKPGPHVINVIRKGNINKNTIDSPVSSCSFVQLAPIETISIANNRISVQQLGVNLDADDPEIDDDVIIKLETLGGGLSDPKETFDLSMVFNTTDIVDENYLSAGAYVSYVYVIGDGSKTFSYMNGGSLIASASCEFSVLTAPEISFTDSSKFEFEFTAESDNYTIYENESVVNDSFEGTTYPFTLNSGSKTFRVQANGNRTNILSSTLSDEITIFRLNQPELSFDNATNKLSIDYKNNINLINDYVIKLKNYTYADFTEIDYTFGSEFTEFEVGENDIKVYLQSVLEYDDVYYLHSKETSIKLTKLDCDTSFELVDNRLIVKSKNKQQTNLELTFNLNSGEKKFCVVDTNLVCGSYILPFTCSTDSNDYVIYTIDLTNNYNAVVPEFLDDFTVKTSYKINSNTIVNSDESTYSNAMKLARIDAESNITINANNQLTITPLNHSEEYYLNVKIIIASVEYDFASNADKELLQYSTNILRYTYNSGSYFIDLLNGSYLPVFTLMDSDFSVQVKYLNKTTISDLDSDYTEVKNVTKLQTATLSRDGEYLIFNNPYNSYTYNNYAIVVNGNQTINLDSSAVNDETNIVVPFEYIYSRINSVEADTVYSIAVLTKNYASSAETPLLSSIGESIKVKRQGAPVLTSYKYNNNEDGNDNNSVVVQFDTVKNDYAKTYNLIITNGVDSEIKTYIINADVDVSTKSLILDDISLLGTLKVSVNIETIGIDSDVYVFNSKASNELEFYKVAAPTGISVSNSTLTFSDVPNTDYYELYEVVGGSNYTKIGNPIATGSYEITSWTGTKNLALKSISKVGGYTNSVYSTTFTLTKLSQPEVIVEKGNFKVVNVPIIDGITIKLKVLNQNTGIYIERLVSSSTIYINASEILNYGVDSILEENIDFRYIVKV